MTIPEAMISIALSTGYAPTATVSKFSIRKSVCLSTTLPLRRGDFSPSTFAKVKVNITPSIWVELYPIEEMRQKIRYFMDMEKPSFMHEKPSLLAVESSLRLLRIFGDNGIYIQNTLAMADGGISFTFFIASCYYCIEIYNDGGIVHSRRPQGGNSVIRDVSFEEVKDELYLMKQYGD